jgi:hypothetical protein
VVDDMKQRNKLIAVVCAILSLGMATVLVTTNQPTTDTQIKRPVKFVLSSWAYSGTEYGQGIVAVSMGWLNGSTYDNCGWFWPYTEFSDFEHGGEWFYNTTLVLSVGLYMNGTLVGVDDWETGLNYVRLNLTISSDNGTVFSENNLTYAYGLDESLAPNYYYVFNASISCFNTPTVYVAALTYEVYGVIP